jgi:DNA-binding transcriptional ArsR family regulator
MSHDNPDLAAVAALIADPSRAAMLSALLGGHSLPAGELARFAKVSAQTASTHLAKLVSGGLLTVTQTGRHRYYALRNKEVAHALETLAIIAPAQRVRSLSQGLEAQSIRHARTCYDHLAGTLGVMFTEALLDQHIIARNGEHFDVSETGTAWFANWGINCQALQQKRRTFAVACIDWSERKPHLAGALGAAVVDRMFAMKWVVRSDKSRAVKVTEAGHKMLNQELGLTLR